MPFVGFELETKELGDLDMEEVHVGAGVDQGKVREHLPVVLNHHADDRSLNLILIITSGQGDGHQRLDPGLGVLVLGVLVLGVLVLGVLGLGILVLGVLVLDVLRLFLP